MLRVRLASRHDWGEGRCRAPVIRSRLCRWAVTLSSPPDRIGRMWGTQCVGSSRELPTMQMSRVIGVFCVALFN